MKALVVVDMQNDFIDGALGTEEAPAIVANVKAKVEEYKKEGAVIVFTRDTHGENYLTTQEGRKLPVPHCIRGTKGWEICEALKPYAENVLDKPAFGSMELPAFLASKQVSEGIEVCGLCTDICVISNAMILKAAFPEIPMRVDARCCAGVTPVSHTNALAAMRMCQIDVIGE